MKQTNPESVGFSTSRLARINAGLQRYLDAGKYAGMLAMVARHGEIAYSECLGVSDLKSRKPMQDDAIFRIYSMTKPITSAAVMMLLEEGRLRLNDPLSDYLPAFKDLKVVARNTEAGMELEDLQRPITIRNLFTHTAGFSYGFDQNDPLDKLYTRKMWGRVDKPGSTLADMVDALAELPLAHQPGTVFRYSVAIDVLGRLVEVISGQPFDQFLQQRIFEPLGMVDTAFWAPPEKAARLASVYGPDEKRPGHLRNLEPGTRSHYLRPATFFSGGGGLVSTAMDYMRFCQMLLNGGELEGVRLLGRKSVETMRLNHLPEGVYEDPNRAYGFGLGGHVLLHPGRAEVTASEGTWSWGGAANTCFWIDFKEQLVGVLMLQFMPSFLYPVTVDFQNMVYQALVD